MELKDYKGDVYKPMYGSIADARVYLKSEADRYINRQKYKRCLAMAELCNSRMVYYINSCNRYDIIYVNKKATHFFKWKYKWIELAKKFKEEK